VAISKASRAYSLDTPEVRRVRMPQ
jgi:hypothetical protein